jgi:hypothetical protein
MTLHGAISHRAFILMANGIGNFNQINAIIERHFVKNVSKIIQLGLHKITARPMYFLDLKLGPC